MKENPQTVYVVTSGDYSDYRIRGIFSTQELAQQFIDRARAVSEESEAWWTRDVNSMDEWVLDEATAELEFQTWTVAIYLADGAVAWERTETKWGVPKSETGSTYDCVFGLSAESRDHALKLAVETRQRHLREADLKNGQSG